MIADDKKIDIPLAYSILNRQSGDLLIEAAG
jgi:hypothetical protein